MGVRRHADTFVTRWLWEEVCRKVLPGWEDLDPRQQTQECERLRKRWRSLRDRFKREFNEEMQAPSDSARRRRTPYKYGRALSFLRESMLQRVTFSSHQAPASTLAPSGAISQESATEGHIGRPHPSDPLSGPSSTSAPSTSAAASSEAASQPSLLESAGQDVAFPLSHPSDPATSRPPIGSWRQRQRGQERSYAPEFLHLNASFQSSFKILGEQVTAGFNMVQARISENSSRLDRMHSDASQAPSNLFFQPMLRSMEKLSLDQQMQVMHDCHAALLRVMSQGQTPTPPHTATTTFPPQAQYQTTQSQFPPQAQYQTTQSQFQPQAQYQTTQSQYPTQSQLPSRPQIPVSSPMFSSLSSFPSPFSIPPTPTPPSPAQPPVFFPPFHNTPTQ
ncbi:uncharacterized protein LOC143818187 [Ranitomeya variabilis]|uniref:uncharacterized protein LOC143818187 n=1 Tax=Ranitomeya variabilis TaxID=490064 RepID=UPI00405751C9